MKRFWLGFACCYLLAAAARGFVWCSVDQEFYLADPRHAARPNPALIVYESLFWPLAELGTYEFESRYVYPVIRFFNRLGS